MQQGDSLAVPVDRRQEAVDHSELPIGSGRSRRARETYRDPPGGEPVNRDVQGHDAPGPEEWGAREGVADSAQQYPNTEEGAGDEARPAHVNVQYVCVRDRSSDRVSQVTVAAPVAGLDGHRDSPGRQVELVGRLVFVATARREASVGREGPVVIGPSE